jgi:hypothetical protein
MRANVDSDLFAVILNTYGRVLICQISCNSLIVGLALPRTILAGSLLMRAEQLPAANK